MVWTDKINSQGTEKGVLHLTTIEITANGTEMKKERDIVIYGNITNDSQKTYGNWKKVPTK